MDDENEVESLLIGYAIENQHRLHGKVPGSGTVGCGYDDGDGAYDERHQGTAQAQVGGEVETEEGQVVVQEVADRCQGWLRQGWREKPLARKRRKANSRCVERRRERAALRAVREVCRYRGK